MGESNNQNANIILTTEESPEEQSFRLAQESISPALPDPQIQTKNTYKPQFCSEQDQAWFLWLLEIIQKNQHTIQQTINAITEKNKKHFPKEYQFHDEEIKDPEKVIKTWVRNKIIKLKQEEIITTKKNLFSKIKYKERTIKMLRPDKIEELIEETKTKR